MVVVSPNKENLERLIKIINYKDDEYFIYRCFSVSENEIIKENNLYTVNLCGSVAWSVSRWFEWKENKNEKVIIGRDENNNNIYGNAHYITLDILCERLNLGIEIFAEESGCCFQEHYTINHNGECICNESAEWIEHWVDEDGNDLDEPYEEGGLYDYNVFSTPEEIYG
jgi:hypothetical protein